MRNVIAHEYFIIDLKRIWDNATIDIPVLEAFCKDMLNELQALEDNSKTSSANSTIDPTPDLDPELNPTPRFKP